MNFDREHLVRSRQRGRILTPDGLSRLRQAIRTWELKHEVRCTQERIKELTSAIKEGGLDPGTIRKILKAKEGVDPESIRCLFITFDLQLSEADLISSARLNLVDPNFVGREGASSDLNTLMNRGAKVIVIQARGGVGKTTLARKYLQQEFGSYLEFTIAKETKDIASIEGLIEEKLRQLGEEPGREFFVSLDRLKRKLQDERIGILIDNLEPALDAAGKFIEPHRRYLELLRVLADPSVQSITLITTRERLRESSITVEHYMLKSLDIQAWEQFFQSRNLPTDIPAFAALHNAYGGNAKAMDIIRGAILEDYSGDVAAYWQANQNDLFIERDLEDLVTQQFERLQQIDSDAYNLLCRMGCYRYQDVPTVPIAGLLCLLWDVPQDRQRRVVKSLQDRSLVEFESGEYWLHPITRGEALNRLNDKDWEESNRIAARFWLERTRSIDTIEDALEALESYNHYIEIRDFNLACKVIVQSRKNKWIEDEYLGRSVYRFGLLNKLIFMINQIVENIESVNVDHSLGRLYEMLGVGYVLSGDANKSIEFFKTSKELAISLDLQPLTLDCIINTALCKTYLWEIDDSITHFEEAASIAAQLKFDGDLACCWSHLAFLNSCLKSEESHRKASTLADRAYQVSFSVTHRTILRKGWSLFCLGSAYRNLDVFERAIELYEKTITYAEETYCEQLKGKALTGLSGVFRQQEDFEKALTYHSKAISYFEKIGAVSDIAEAYYELALTHGKMKKNDLANENFNKATQIFEKIHAPKQVERVRRSMQTNTNS